MASKIFVSVVMATFLFLFSSDAVALHPELLALKASINQAKGWSEQRAMLMDKCFSSGAPLEICRAVLDSYRSDVSGAEPAMDSFELCMAGSSNAHACYEVATAWGLSEWLSLPFVSLIYLFMGAIFILLLPVMIGVTIVKVPLFFLGMVQTWYLVIW